MIKWVWFILWLVITNPVLASIEVILQPNPAQVGQELKFIIKQKGRSSAHGIPDISALERDFQIIGTQQSMSYQFINGVSEHENIWTILLLPIHSGKIKLPSISVGGEQTPAQEIMVDNESAIIQNAQKSLEQSSESNVFMQWQVTPQAPILHEAIKIKIDIYHAVPLLDAKLSLPKVNNGLLFSRDQPQHAVMMRSGKRYEIESYAYFVYPQKLGQLTIRAPVLDALAYGAMPEPVHLSLPSKILKISSVLPDANHEILPAKKLEYRFLPPLLNSSDISMGDAVTKTLKITALGAPYHLIPDLNLSCGPHCKVYVKVKQNFNKFVAGELKGHRVLEVTYIPGREGFMQASDIEIPWFNTEKRTMEKLVVPGFKMLVKPENILNTMPSIKIHKSKEALIERIPTWLSILLGVGFGIGFAFVYPQLRNRNWVEFLKQLEFKHQSLKKACYANQAKKAKLALIEWGQKNFAPQEIHELHDIMGYLPDGVFRSELQNLIQYLYAKEGALPAWNGRALWIAFKGFSYRKNTSPVVRNFSNGLNP